MESLWQLKLGVRTDTIISLLSEISSGHINLYIERIGLVADSLKTLLLKSTVGKKILLFNVFVKKDW